MKSLIVDGLGKCYHLGKRKQHKELWALRDVSFDVSPGTILGVIGPNGAGKTTLLKVLSRVTPPTEGRVRGWGRVVPLLALGTGFSPEITGRENIFLNAAMHGIPRAHVQKKLGDIVEFAGVEGFLDTPVRHYSSGMYLRLAFSVAMNVDPDILLADEVLAVGDLDFQERCLAKVQEAGRAGLTVLFVSHDMAAITRLCNRVLWLNAGRIVRLGAPDEVVTAYQNSAWTLASAKLKKQCTVGHVHEWGEILSVRLLSRQGEEIGAVRISEDVFVNLAFSLSQPGANVRCAIDVYAQGVHAFRSVQPAEMPVERCGAYNAWVRIPGHLLAETIYTVNASANITWKGEERPIVEYNALSFRVYDTDEKSSARGTYEGRLPGVVMPRLEWRVVEERDAAGMHPLRSTS